MGIAAAIANLCKNPVDVAGELGVDAVGELLLDQAAARVPAQGYKVAVGSKDRSGLVC